MNKFKVGDRVRLNEGSGLTKENSGIEYKNGYIIMLVQKVNYRDCASYSYISCSFLDDEVKRSDIDIYTSTYHYDSLVLDYVYYRDEKLKQLGL
jgi:hypothetical protein